MVAALNLDGPGHAPPYLSVSQSQMLSVLIFMVCAVVLFIVPLVVLRRLLKNSLLIVIPPTVFSLLGIMMIGGLTKSYVEELQISAIKSWCTQNMLSYLSHRKRYEVGRNSTMLGVHYLVTVREESDPLLLKTGNWLTGSMGWNVVR